MFYNEKFLRDISGTVDYINFEEIYDNLNEALTSAVSLTNQQLPGASLSSDIYPIGSFVTHTNSNPQCTLDYAIESSNISIIDNDIEFVNTKNVKKRELLLTTEKIKKVFTQMLATFFTSATNMHVSDNYIFVESVYEIGFNIKIYICVKDSTNLLLALNTGNNKIFHFNFEEYIKLIEEKNDQTMGQFKRIINIVVNLLYNNQITINNFCIENLLYNVPNELYSGTYTEEIIKILNYLNIVVFKNFKCVECDELIIDNAFLNTNYYLLKFAITKVVDSLR